MLHARHVPWPQTPRSWITHRVYCLSYCILISLRWINGVLHAIKLQCILSLIRWSKTAVFRASIHMSEWYFLVMLKRRKVWRILCQKKRSKNGHLHDCSCGKIILQVWIFKTTNCTSPNGNYHRVGFNIRVLLLSRL